MHFVPLKIVGLVWYKKEDYERIIALSKDGNIFARRFEDWLSAAEKQASRLEVQGFTVVRAEINPDTFPAWCAAHGVDVNAEGRSAFASFSANEFRKKQQSRN